MRLFFLFLLFISNFSFAQTETKPVIDSLFREDQFYVSVSYNVLQKTPDNFSQYSFSTGLSAGFLRDFPISENRHWAIAPGIGYSFNDLKQNIDFSSISDNTNTELVKSRILLHYLDIPLEIRWRNATPDSHKFWRIYGGFMASYLINGKFKYEGSLGSGTENINDLLNK
ncbi:MAG: porin family protein, partial [Flavobacterium sp.]